MSNTKDYIVRENEMEIGVDFSKPEAVRVIRGYEIDAAKKLLEDAGRIVLEREDVATFAHDVSVDTMLTERMSWEQRVNHAQYIRRDSLRKMAYELDATDFVGFLRLHPQMPFQERRSFTLTVVKPGRVV